MMSALKAAPLLVFSLAFLSWNPSPAAAQGRSLAVDTVFRVDGHESVLEPIRFLVAGPAEEVAIVGSISKKVRTFSASGEELSPFGRGGQGPGEFVFMNKVGWKGDSLWVFDSQNLRFTLFCPGKEGFHTYPAQMGVQPSEGTDLPSFGSMIPIALRTDGSMLGTLGSPSSPDWVGGYKTIGLVGPEGTLQRTFARYRTPEGFFRVGDRGQTVGWSYPFEHSPKFDVSSDGSAAALALVEMRGDRDGVVVVTRFDQSGDTVFSVALPFEGVGIPRSTRSEALREYADRALLTGGSASLRRQYLQNDKTPEVYPPITDLIVEPRGATWLQVRWTGADSVFLRLGPGGEVEGTLRLAEGAKLLDARGPRLWVTVKDQYDVESVLGLRVRMGG